MDYITPEAAGISSKNIVRYLDILADKRLATHSIIMARGNDIFFEKYWKPFNAEFKHRLYSVSKSFVSIAIGFLVQDGKLSLDDTMEKHFSAELKNQPDINMHNQTVRDMLMMATAKPNRNWFIERPNDRVKFYFENDRQEARPSGTVFSYDSEGSFVLCALVERITKKTLIEYLREKLFDKIGVSEDIYCLKCPGGHSWGDSGIICKPMDLLKVARFVLNGGSWNGEQILDSEYVKNATENQIFVNEDDINNSDTYGYGWQFWKTYEESFYFNGMGCQYAVCVPKKDLILIYNADNQGKEFVRQCIIDSFFELIVDKISDKPLPENVTAYDNLEKRTENLNLICANGDAYSDFQEEVCGRVYKLSENPMKIEYIKLEIDGACGRLFYKNQQGEKILNFGMCKNIISDFPQEGYSDECGTVEKKGNFYKCAASAAWVEPKKLYIKVQIIDKYFGNLGITIGFKDDVCGVYMVKHAEAFLEEYQGFAGGTLQEKKE